MIALLATSFAGLGVFLVCHFIILHKQRADGKFMAIYNYAFEQFEHPYRKLILTGWGGGLIIAVVAMTLAIAMRKH